MPDVSNYEPGVPGIYRVETCRLQCRRAVRPRARGRRGLRPWPLRTEGAERVNHFGRKRKREGNSFALGGELYRVQELAYFGMLPGLETSERHESTHNILEILRRGL